WLPLKRDTMEHARRMADGCDRFAGTVEGLDEGDGAWILSQVPHRAVAAGIEDRVVIRGFDVTEPQGVCQHCLGCGILLETPRQFGLALRCVADRVERRLPPVGRGAGHCRPGIEKGVVGRGALAEPEAGLASRVAELVVRRDDHQDLHAYLVVLERVRSTAQRLCAGDLRSSCRTAAQARSGEASGLSDHTHGQTACLGIVRGWRLPADRRIAVVPGLDDVSPPGTRATKGVNNEEGLDYRSRHRLWT